MAIIERCTTITAPIERVYRVSQDYAVRYAWDPFPERIAFVDGTGGEPVRGAQVDIRSRAGLTMRVEFVQVQPPTRAAVKMVRGPWMLASFAGSWIFEPASTDTTQVAEATRVRFRYGLTARPSFLRGLIEPLAVLYFSRVVERRLAGLKAYCEGDR